MVESFDKTWSTGEGNGKPLQYSCLENPMNTMKRQKGRTLKYELPKSVVPNMLLKKSREIAPEGIKRLSQSGNMPTVDVSGGESKVQCCEEQYRVGVMPQVYAPTID